MDGNEQAEGIHVATKKIALATEASLEVLYIWWWCVFLVSHMLPIDWSIRRDSTGPGGGIMLLFRAIIYGSGDKRGTEGTHTRVVPQRIGPSHARRDQTNHELIWKRRIPMPFFCEARRSTAKRRQEIIWG